MKLAEQAGALAFDTAFWLLGFEEEDGLDVDQLGVASIEIGAKLRALAIIALLTRGDSEKFLHTLVRSGRVRETFLSRVKHAQHSGGHHFASGRVDGLMDAVAAGDLDLARRIAWLSPRRWEPQREYEEDYCYAQVVHRLVHRVQDAATYQPLLAQFETALQGTASAKLATVRALVARSPDDFNSAFGELLAERSSEITEDIARSQLEDAQVIASRHVFVEGLALLRLAGIAGLRTEAEYLYCPSSARADMRVPVPTEPGGA